MTLTWTVVAAVLLGALLHASWNALVKSSIDKALDTALIHLLGSLVALPIALIIGWPPAQAWPFILASAVIHMGYYIAAGAGPVEPCAEFAARGGLCAGQCRGDRGLHGG